MQCRLTLWAGCLVAAFACLLLTAAPASAHTALVSSSPADGQTLQHAPRRIHLTFTEDILVDSVRVTMRDRDADTTMDLQMLPTSAAATSIDLAVPRVAPDIYVVAWAVTSVDDGHRVTGSFAFGVRREAAALATTDRTADSSEGALAIVGTLGSALAVSGLLLGGWLVPRQTSGSEQRFAARLRTRAGWLVVAGAGLAAVAGLLALVHTTDVATVATVLATPRGVRELMRVAALGAAAVLVLRGLRTGSRVEGGVAATLVVASVAAAAFDGHAAGDGLLSGLVAALHAVAASVWAGGVAALALLVTPLLFAGPDGRAFARRVLGRFAVPALVCLAVLVLTGLLLLGRQVSTLQAAVDTPYGLTLGVKLLCVSVASLLGLRHLLVLHGPFVRPLGRRSLGIEGAAVVAVLVLAALLTATPPARGPGLEPAAEGAAGSTTRDVFLEDMLVRVTLSPDVTGPAAALILVADFRRPSPGPVSAVDVAVAGTEVAAEKVGRSKWQAPVELPAVDTTVSVTVHRPGLRLSVASFSLPQKGRLPFMQHPLEPVTRLLALMLALVLGVGAAVALRLTDRRRRLRWQPSRSHTSRVPPADDRAGSKALR